MNLCIISFQAVLLAVLVQYHYINEVDAESRTYHSIGDWFSSVEKRVNKNSGRISMNKEYQQFKKTIENILAHPRRLIHQIFGTGIDIKDPVNKDHKEGVKISDLLKSQEQRDLLAVNDVSDMTGEVNNEAEPEATYQVALENPKSQEAPKRKSKLKKHKKKNKVKRDHHEHLPHEQRLDASVEQDNIKSAKKNMRKSHKREKERIHRKTFVKTLPKESNSSESDEVMKRRQPVDIIVHIKMND